VRYLEAGADDVIGSRSTPVSSRRGRGVLVRSSAPRDLAPSSTPTTKVRLARSIIACLQPEGRCRHHDDRGEALRPPRAQAPGKVLIFDFDLQFGQVATHSTSSRS